MSKPLEDLRLAREAHQRAFRAAQQALTDYHRALVAARSAGESWEAIADAAGRKSSLGPAVAASVIRTETFVAWRSGKYPEFGEVPDEALNRHEQRERDRRKKETSTDDLGS